MLAVKVSHQRNPLHAGNEACKWGDSFWIWNPEQTLPEVQNKGISRITIHQIFKLENISVFVMLLIPLIELK